LPRHPSGSTVIAAFFLVVWDMFAQEYAE